MYDNLGRQTQDRVTAVPEDDHFDDTIRRIERSYDDRGRVTSIKSYDDPDVGEGNVKNEVTRSYSDWGPVVTSWQAHTTFSTTTGGSESPKVQYAYDDGLDGLCSRRRVQQAAGQAVGPSCRVGREET